VAALARGRARTEEAEVKDDPLPIDPEALAFLASELPVPARVIRWLELDHRGMTYRRQDRASRNAALEAFARHPVIGQTRAWLDRSWRWEYADTGPGAAAPPSADGPEPLTVAPFAEVEPDARRLVGDDPGGLPEGSVLDLRVTCNRPGRGHLGRRTVVLRFSLSDRRGLRFIGGFQAHRHVPVDPLFAVACAVALALFVAGAAVWSRLGATPALLVVAAAGGPPAWWLHRRLQSDPTQLLGTFHPRDETAQDEQLRQVIEQLLPHTSNASAAAEVYGALVVLLARVRRNLLRRLWLVMLVRRGPIARYVIRFDHQDVIVHLDTTPSPSGPRLVFAWIPNPRSSRPRVGYVEFGVGPELKLLRARIDAQPPADPRGTLRSGDLSRLLTVTPLAPILAGTFTWLIRPGAAAQVPALIGLELAGWVAGVALVYAVTRIVARREGDVRTVMITAAAPLLVSALASVAFAPALLALTMSGLLTIATCRVAHAIVERGLDRVRRRAL
jgi:hypothetical protein